MVEELGIMGEVEEPEIVGRVDEPEIVGGGGGGKEES